MAELFRRSSKLKNFTCDTLEVSLSGEFEPGQYDIGAIYQSNKDARGVVFCGNQGNFSEFPYIEHIDQRGQYNNIRCTFDSRIRIYNAGEIKKIWILIWDHELFEVVKIPAPFREEGLQVKIALFNDSKPILDEPVKIYFNTDTDGNLAITPEIDMHDPKSLTITNISNAYIIPGFKKYMDLILNTKLEIIPGFVEKIMGEDRSA